MIWLPRGHTGAAICAPLAALLMAGCAGDNTTVIGTPLTDGGSAALDGAKTDTGKADVAGKKDTGVKPDIPFSGCKKPGDCPLSGPCKEGVCKSNGVCGEKNIADGTACDDGDPCNLDDICAKGLCDGNGVLDCDDGKPCTTDTCTMFVGCAHEAAADGSKCTAKAGPGTCAKGICQPN